MRLTGLPAARGGGKWSAVQVARVQERVWSWERSRSFGTRSSMLTVLSHGYAIAGIKWAELIEDTGTEVMPRFSIPAVSRH